MRCCTMAHSRHLFDVLQQLKSDDYEGYVHDLSYGGSDIQIGGGLEVRGRLKQGLRGSEVNQCCLRACTVLF